jgi:TolB-like protein/DNA-binding winged helix-turn-helix (wHTH) protein/Tfp pilus assembly protein PilF
MPAPALSRRILRFGPFELNVDTGQLRKSGIELRLRPQAAKVLALLATQPGEVVRRDQLREELWGRDVFVDYDHGLNLCVREIRAALDDDADKPRYIETLPRIGYRFLAHVEEVAPQADPAPSAEPKNCISGQSRDANRTAEPAKKLPSRRWALAGGISLVGVALIAAFAFRGLRERLGGTSSARIESLAVLPLENLSGSPEQQYFADGMTDELITELAKIHSLRVISRNSIMQYQGKSKPLQQIARELHVDAIVEGTVMRSGDRVRITAQLIAAPQDRHLWAERYEGDLHDVLQLQDDVARDIASQVQAGLTSAERARFAQTRAVNPYAYEMLLKGRYEWAKRGREGLTKALDYFQQSAHLDPNFAPAYVGIAESYGLLGNGEIMAASQVYPKAKSAALKALEFDPDLSEAHCALAEVLNDYEWNWAQAEQEYKRAIELDPNNANAHHWYAMSLIWNGRTGDAIAEIERARQLDPAGVRINANVGLIYLWTRQYDRAMAQAQKTSELEPNESTSILILAQVNLKKGNHQTAISQLKTLASLPGIPKARGLAWLAWGYALAGQKDEARAILGRLKRLSPQEYCPPTSMAMVYSALGEKDEAFAWLDRALREHDGIQLLSIKVNLYFDPLRSDPRFVEVLRRRGLAE